MLLICKNKHSIQIQNANRNLAYKNLNDIRLQNSDQYFMINIAIIQNQEVN